MVISQEAIKIYESAVKAEGKFIQENLTLDLIVRWDYTPKVEVKGRSIPGEETIFRAIMFEKGNLVYQADIHAGMFATGFKRWVTNYEIQVWNKKNKLLSSWKLLDKIRDSKVLISFDSSSLGDTLAWMPYVEKFIDHYGAKKVIVTSFWNELFETEYPAIDFKHPGYRESDLEVILGMGWFDESDRNIHQEDPRTIPLQKVAADLLGTPFQGEIRPRLRKKILDRPTPDKYVCIATDSTAGAKYWHYPGGWQRLVDLLRRIGYKVVVIQKEETQLQNIINKTGKLPIEERISDLLQCEFFIGLGSGLSWLSWALDKPTVMISGFSQPFCEFSDKTLRIINKDVCHGCFNDPAHKFDRGDWWWCPVHKGTDRYFECTRTIKPEDVFIQILDWLPSVNPSSLPSSLDI